MGVLFSDGTRVHARAAESDLRTPLDRASDDAFEVLVAVWCLLPGEPAADRVAEDADLFAVALGERVCEPEAVVGALGPVRGVVEDDECLHLDQTLACAGST